MKEIMLQGKSLQIQLYTSFKIKVLDLDICLNRIRVTGNRDRIAVSQLS